MELIKQNIHMDRIKCLTGTQMTLEHDVNIPDSRPDAAEIVLSRGNIVVEEGKASDNHVLMKGKLLYNLLIRSETGGLYGINGEIPFEEQAYMEGITPTDTADILSHLEDMTVGLINSRKLSVQAVAGFKLCVNTLWDEEMVTGIMTDEEADGAIECRKMKKEVAQIVMQTKDIFRIKEEIELPQNYPNIMDIIWSSVQLLNVECKLLEEKIAVQGSAQLFVLYESEGEEGKLRTYETTIPFGGTIDCYGCRETLLPSIRFEEGIPNIEVRTDFDGEERAIGLEMVLNMDIRLYEENNLEYVDDAYGIDKELEMKRSDSFYKKLLLYNSDKLKVSGQLEAPKTSDGILQILHTDAAVQMDEMRQEGGTVTAEGAVRMQLLLATGEAERPFARAEGYLPFTYETDLHTEKNRCSYEIQPVLSAVMATLSGSGEIEAKAIINFNILAFEDMTESKVTEMKIAEADSDKRNRLPGIIGYRVQNGDELWEIGKRYYVPISQILEFNNLSSENVRAGDKLLIVKQGRSE